MEAKKLPSYLQALYDELPLGLVNAKTVRQLRYSTGLTEREVYRQAEELILYHGVPVCGSREVIKGLYIATTEEERERGLRHLIQQNNSVDKHIKAVQGCMLLDYKIY